MKLFNRRRIFYGLKIIVCYVFIASLLLSPSTLAHYKNIHAAIAVADTIRPKISKPKSSNVVVKIELGAPASIHFARQDKTIDITPGVYSPVQKTWIVMYNNVEWITANTELVNSKPTVPTVMYGHNSNIVLGVAQHPVANDIVILTYKTSIQVAYEYINDSVVDPTNLLVLSVKDPNYLALLTCTGSDNQYRHLLHFSFIGVIK